MRKSAVRSAGALIRLHEGCRSKPYRCTGGALTIGIGRNLDANGLRESEWRIMFSNDVSDVHYGLLRALPWFKDLDEVRRAVLTDMAFNLGLNGLLKWKNTLRAVKAGRYEVAAANMRKSLWAKQVKTRSVRLARMMITGEWPDVSLKDDWSDPR